MTPENFRGAFTAAEGWGSYAQRFDANRFEASVALKWGAVRLRELSLSWPEGMGKGTVVVSIGIASLPASLRRTGDRVTVELAASARLHAGESLTLHGSGCCLRDVSVAGGGCDP